MKINAVKNIIQWDSFAFPTDDNLHNILGQTSSLIAFAKLVVILRRSCAANREQFLQMSSMEPPKHGKTSPWTLL